MAGTTTPVAADAPTVVIRLTPGFSVISRGVVASVPSTSQRLIAYVALVDRPMTRMALASRLWPDLELERGAAALRSTLWQVRRKLPGVLSADSKTVRISSGVYIDHRSAIAAARTFEHDSAIISVEPYLDDLLVEWHEEWVEVERERYRQIRLHVLEDLCQRFVLLGRTATAIEVGLAAVAADPLRETAQRVLIQAHLADGNLSEAVREYRAYSQLLLEILGVAPSTSLTSLVCDALNSAEAGRHAPTVAAGLLVRSRAG